MSVRVCWKQVVALPATSMSSWRDGDFQDEFMCFNDRTCTPDRHFLLNSDMTACQQYIKDHFYWWFSSDHRGSYVEGDLGNISLCAVCAAPVDYGTPADAGSHDRVCVHWPWWYWIVSIVPFGLMLCCCFLCCWSCYRCCVPKRNNRPPSPPPTWGYSSVGYNAAGVQRPLLRVAGPTR